MKPTITRNGETSVIVTINKGRSAFYPYQDINAYVEISAELDHETLKLKKWHGETEFHYRLLTSMTDSLARWVGLDQAAETVGLSVINKAKKEIRLMVSEINHNLSIARSNPLYIEMQPIAAAKVRLFSTDFTFHDCLSIYDTQRFVWMIRETGTWLLKNKSDFNKCILMQNEDHEYYTYNGKLAKCDKETAARFYETLPN